LQTPGAAGSLAPPPSRSCPSRRDGARAGTEEIVRARRITAAGALEPAIDLTGPGLTSKLPKVEAAPSGAVTVIWLRTPVGTVHLRRIDPAGGPGATLDRLHRRHDQAAAWRRPQGTSPRRQARAPRLGRRAAHAGVAA
jgi:hypothetical protein